MNIVFLCNTYYQAIVAIQLRLTAFKNDTVYLVMSDHSKGTKEFVSKLGDLKVFEDVHYAETFADGINVYNKKYPWSLLMPAIIGKGGAFAGIKNLKCDYFIYYNTTISTHQLFAKLYNKNKHMKRSKI